MQFEVKGGTTGFVRSLWRLDATHKSLARTSTFSPLRMNQSEFYSGRTTLTRLEFDGRSVTSTKTHRPRDNSPPEKRTFTFPSTCDLHTAMLFVRSQRLMIGDTLSVVVFPANAPYFATVRVAGREKIRVRSGEYHALKLDVRLQKINASLGLEPHKKVKRLTAWISDDSDRLLLRAEAEIFVGSVWAELQDVSFGTN